MATLEALRHQVDTAGDLLSIVRTLKLLSAVNMRQFEKCVQSLDAYQTSIERGMQVVLQQRFEVLQLSRAAASSGCGVVVFGADHGLCGSFNQTIAHVAADWLTRQKALLFVVGGRLADEMSASNQPATAWCGAPNSIAGMRSVVEEIVIQLDAWQQQRSVDRIVVFHHLLRGGVDFEPCHGQLLPFSVEWLEDLATRPWQSRRLPTFRAAPQRLFSSLSRHHLFGSVFRALAHSMASENAARFVAMSTAEQNIGERLELLRLKYDQQRQSTITEEMLDIVSGFDVLTRKKIVDT